MNSKIFMFLSGFNFASAFAFSVKFMFVVPELSGVYYGTVSWVCGFGFALLYKAYK